MRTVVAYLGERDLNGWWQSSFFGTGSKAFLSPVFSRTETLAQYHGASAAAARIHDERIGVGEVFHLFRLPEYLEQEIHQALTSSGFVKTITDHLGSADTAMKSLKDVACPVTQDTVGPVRVGGLDALREDSGWAVVAGHYAEAFDKGMQVYPYFSDIE